MVFPPRSVLIALSFLMVCSCKPSSHARFTSATNLDDVKKSIDEKETFNSEVPELPGIPTSASAPVIKKQKAKRPPLPPKPDREHHVVFCQSNNQEYYHVVQNEVLALKLGKEKDIALTIYDGYGSTERQIEQIRYAALGKPDVIVITPHEGNKLTGIVSEAKQAGIKIVSLENPMPQADAQFLIDNEQVGEMAGHVIVQAMEQKAREFQQSSVSGRVVEIMGQVDGDTSMLRHQGFVKALGKQPGLLVVHEAPGYWNHADARERMKEAMKLQKPVEVVYAHNDAMAVGAYLAAEDAGLQQELLYVGTGGLPGQGGGLKSVADRTLNFTVSLPILTDLAADTIIKMIREPAYAPASRQVVNVELVTARNAVELEEKRSAELRAIGN